MPRPALANVMVILAAATLTSIAGGAAGCGGGSSPTTDGGGGDVDARGGGDDGGGGPDGGPPTDPLIDRGEVAVIEGGFEFLEGPQWRAATGDLLFTDIPGNRIHRYVPGDGVDVLRPASDNANGLALDPDGALIACEHGTRRVTRIVGDDVTPLAESFEELRLNSPNDAVVRSDGTIYFTDPPYGIGDVRDELDFMGVFRIAPGGTLTAEYRGALAERPNGIALSPDERTLYVTDTTGNVVRAHAVATDGSLGAPRVLANVASPDGLAVDAAGNLFVTSSAGIEVLGADGSRWGNIPVDEQPANCAFGGAGNRTLFITARTTLFVVELAGAGLPTH